MKIIIAGSGEVGSHLAKLLSYESQEITLIDSNDEKLTFPNSQLDIRVVQGDCTSISVLNKANVSEADLFVGVTAGESTNLTACYLAKQLGAKKTIARISNPELLENENIDFSNLGISELVSPELLTSKEINMVINRAEFTDPFEFDDGALITLGLSATHTSTFVGKTVVEAAEIFPETHFFPISIKRDDKTIIPRGDTVFHSGDHIVFMTEPGGEEELLKLSGQNNGEIKNVMILGGGRVGKKVAEDLSSDSISVKLVEINKERAEELAEELAECLVIYGDGTNSELLDEEHLDQMDAFIAVTGDSETNIMSSLIAKAKGINKTIALVDNLDYYKLTQISGIDTLINKKLLAADAISKHVHKAEVVAISQLDNMDAELLEFVVKENSKVCNKTIKDLDFPRCAIIAGVIRDGKGYIVLGDFKVLSDDRIVVCCLNDSIQKVEKLF
ncbi:MAG: Trk system potassium transporter TrkA [Flavobacteriaceae bacterium]|jgi:trk system potassium uptake protein TrkA|nr:MAG: Trk system potassium transporter TrkA [Bacteroidota bacterium]|tara:strand:- start:1721 stop:3058 length:1338 start_codon:yes stop_codon:yes gene_type:complete